MAEITAAGKPAIFIPLPTAADDHQRHNARRLASGGAALLLPQAELSGDRLAARDGIAADRSRRGWRRWAQAARQFAHPHAAAEIAALAARIAGVQARVTL